MPADRPEVLLCAGMQSSGSTVVSWCFLQRADTRGILDMENDVLRDGFDKFDAPVRWCKMTIGAFRWTDVAGYLDDLGFDAVPMLIVRDVRNVLASLVTKEYGWNGVTAEEPPLRMRMRRFLADWTLFRSNGWPMMRYEDFVDRPRQTLELACKDLGLPWDDAMLHWPRPVADILIPGREGYNSTFTATISQRSLVPAIASWRRRTADEPPRLPRSEIDWLETTFADFNRVHGYPERASRAGVTADRLPPPAYRDGPRRGLR